MLLLQKNISNQDPAKVFISHQNFASNNNIFCTEHIKAFTAASDCILPSPEYWTSETCNSSNNKSNIMVQQKSANFPHRGCSRRRKTVLWSMPACHISAVWLVSTRRGSSVVTSFPKPKPHHHHHQVPINFPAFLRFPLSLSEASGPPSAIGKLSP